MARVYRTLRNNWKKSLFGAGCLYFAGKWIVNKHWEHELRRAYCAEAKKFGMQPVSMGAHIPKVTVFLNPAANKGEAAKLFEKNAAPILHMAGMQVSLMKTEYEGQVKKYMEVLEDTDAILVAGGDGTLLEVVTGMMRRKRDDPVRRVPVGVVPLGQKNKFARDFSERDTADALLMMNSAMSVVKMVHRPVDVMHIKSLNADDRDVYALSELRWSTLKQAERSKSKYWYVGGLKDRLSYALAAIRVPPTLRQVRCDVSISPPCSGCSRCLPAPPSPPPTRWWHAFQPRHPPRLSAEQQRMEYLSRVENPLCGVMSHQAVTTSELALCSRKPKLNEQVKGAECGIHVVQAPEDEGQWSFFTNGMWRVRHAEEELTGSSFSTARSVILQPKAEQSGADWFIIDNEEYEVMPVQVTWLGNAIQVLGSKELLVDNLPRKGTILWDLLKFTKLTIGAYIPLV